MSKRKRFFASLPGNVVEIPGKGNETRLEVCHKIELPSGASCEKAFELRLGRVLSKKVSGIVVFCCVAQDGLTGLPETFTSRWRAVRYLIEQQGGVDLLIKARAKEVSELFKKYRSWEVALNL